MSLDAALKRMGFKSLSPAVRCCRAGDLVHAVVLGQDRYGRKSISPVVWHPTMLACDEKFCPASIQSPVSGNLSPLGIHSSWTWKKSEIQPLLISSMLQKFFAGFSTLLDIQNATEGRFLTPFFKERLTKGTTVLEVEALGLPAAIYPIEGGVLRRSYAIAIARSFLAELVEPLGFSMVESDDVVAILRRGDMYDCVRLLLDEFCTFASITCFPWTKAVWQVEKRWKGTYYPMVRFDVCQDGHPQLLELRKLKQVDITALRALICESMKNVTSVSSVDEFRLRLGPEWSSIANSLRVWRRAD